jgi:DnaJ-class molecular chaperone
MSGSAASSTPTDPYVQLGISQKASEDEIKSAYRKLAKTNHPDKGGDPAIFLKIKEAYTLLSNPEHRSVFDQYGYEGVEMMKKTGVAPSSSGMGMNPQHPFAGMPGFPFPHPMNMMGPRGPMAAAPSGGAPKKIPERVITLEVQPWEAYQGKSISYRLKRRKFTTTTGAKTSLPSCGHCKGQGKISSRPPGIPAFVMVPMTVQICSSCAGLGIVIQEKDMTTVTEVLTLDLPMFCPDGYKIVVPKKTDEIPTLETGDVIFVVKHMVSKNKAKLATDDNHKIVRGSIITKISITLEEALFRGFRKTVTFFDDVKYDLVLPPYESFFRYDFSGDGAQRQGKAVGDFLRIIPEKGFYLDPTLEAREKGDWLISFTIEVPKGDTRQWYKSLCDPTMESKTDESFHTEIKVHQLDCMRSLVDKENKETGAAVGGEEEADTDTNGGNPFESSHGGPQVMHECRTS